MALKLTLEHTRAAFAQIKDITENGNFISYNHTADSEDTDNDFVSSIDVFDTEIAEKIIFHLAVVSLEDIPVFTHDYEYPKSVEPKRLLSNLEEVRKYVTYLPDTYNLPAWNIDLTFGGQES